MIETGYEILIRPEPETPFLCPALENALGPGIFIENGDGSLRARIKERDRLETILAGLSALLNQWEAAGEQVPAVAVRDLGRAEPDAPETVFEPLPGLKIHPVSADEPEPDVRDGLLLHTGRAFGTGLHPTTKISLGLLQTALETRPNPGPVLDIGCGSGILFLTALWMGAPGALGFDPDPEAALTARKNILANGFSDRARVFRGTAGAVKGSWPLILMNLTLSVLVVTAPALPRLLAPGGLVVASGFSPKQTMEVKSLFQNLGAGPIKEQSLNGWSGILFSSQN